MNSTRNHAHSVPVKRSVNRVPMHVLTFACTCTEGTYSLAVEIEMSLCQSTSNQQSACQDPAVANTKGPGKVVSHSDHLGSMDMVLMHAASPQATPLVLVEVWLARLAIRNC